MEASSEKPGCIRAAGRGSLRWLVVMFLLAFILLFIISSCLTDTDEPRWPLGPPTHMSTYSTAGGTEPKMKRRQLSATWRQSEILSKEIHLVTNNVTAVIVPPQERVWLNRRKLFLKEKLLDFGFYDGVWGPHWEKWANYENSYRNVARE